MEKSEQINELAAALSKAQGEMRNAGKNADNPYFKSKYADLGEILNTAKEPLAKYGLAITQLYDGMSSKDISVTTMLMHSSGQYIANTGNYPATKQDIQGVGSAITYARRYSLAAMLGLAQEDDDGNAACQQTQKAAAPKAQEKPEQDSKIFVVRDGYGTKVLLRDGYKYIRDIELIKLEALLTMEQYEAAHEDIKYLLESAQK